MKNKPKAQKPQPTVEQFLSAYPESIQQLTHELRNLILDNVPNLAERVYPGWKLIGYRLHEGKGAYFAFVAAKDDAAFLGFEHGVLLSDPDGLLKGDGHQVRRIRVESSADIQIETFSQFILEASEISDRLKKS